LTCRRCGVDERCALSLFVTTPVDRALDARASALVDEFLGRRPIFIN